MAIYQPAKDVILAAVNAQNSLSIKATDVVFSAPKDIRGTDKGTITGKNTQIKLTAAPVGSGWSGKKNVTYNRLDLADLVTLIGDTLIMGSSVQMLHDGLIGLNNRYGFIFDTGDLDNTEVEWASEGATGKVMLRAKADSVGWIGAYNFNVKRGDESLESAVTTNVLSGLKYPNGQMGSETPTAIMAQVYSYPYNFTAYRDQLLAMAPQVLTGQVLTDITNILKTVTGAAWLATTSATWGLADGRILSVGLNDPITMPTNAKYKYVMVIQLPAATTNITGNLYLQFNDPENPSEV